MGNWIEFAKAVTPQVLELVGDLFTRHKGDAEAAKREITRIRDHRERYVSARDVMEDELAKQQRKAGGEP